MSDFFEMWEQCLNIAPGLEMQIRYHKVTDWTIAIGGRESDKPYYSEQSYSKKVLFASAIVWLDKYMCEKYGGY